MNILAIVCQILSLLAPMIAKVIAAWNESMQGGVKNYDKLLAVALDQVKAVADADWPGESQTEKNLKKFTQAVVQTADAARAIGIAVQDSQVHSAVENAYVLYKQMRAENSTDLVQ